jgi:hypothetical protein
MVRRQYYYTQKRKGSKRKSTCHYAADSAFRTKACGGKVIARAGGKRIMYRKALRREFAGRGVSPRSWAANYMKSRGQHPYAKNRKNRFRKYVRLGGCGKIVQRKIAKSRGGCMKHYY